jgi:hypothetical protein
VLFQVQYSVAGEFTPSLALFRVQLSVAGELAPSLSLFRVQYSVAGEFTPPLALFRRKLSRETAASRTTAFPFPFFCTLLCRRIQTRGLLSLAVVRTPPRLRHLEMIGSVYQHVPIGVVFKIWEKYISFLHSEFRPLD